MTFKEMCPTVAEYIARSGTKEISNVRLSGTKYIDVESNRSYKWEKVPREVGEAFINDGYAIVATSPLEENVVRIWFEELEVQTVEKQTVGLADE